MNNGFSTQFKKLNKKIKKTRIQRKASLKGNWSKEEDLQLINLVKTHGAKNWSSIAMKF